MYIYEKATNKSLPPRERGRSDICMTFDMQNTYTAREASWRRTFDPYTSLWFYLCHYLEQNRYVRLVPKKPILSKPGSILVDGFDTRLIPRSFSCGIQKNWFVKPHLLEKDGVHVATYIWLLRWKTTVWSKKRYAKAHLHQKEGVAICIWLLYIYMHLQIYLYIYMYMKWPLYTKKRQIKAHLLEKEGVAIHVWLLRWKKPMYTKKRLAKAHLHQKEGVATYIWLLRLKTLIYTKKR